MTSGTVFTRLLFWLGMAGFVWAFVGYPVVMIGWARLRRRAARDTEGSGQPPVTVVLAIRNEASRLPTRVENLLASDYPADLLEIVIVGNGCTDGSAKVAGELVAAHPNLRWFESPEAEGKPGGLNRGVAEATGEIVVMADARQRFLPDTIPQLVEALADPEVGAASGRLIIKKANDPAMSGVRRYWELETALREAESETGSVVGVTGAVYALRRELFQPLPPGTVLDDVLVPMRVAFQGKRIAYVRNAIAVDTPSASGGRELKRKVRTLAGNLQLLRLEPRLMSPRANPLFWRFVSHKLMRVAAPWFGATAVTAGLLLPWTLEWFLALALLGVVLLGVVGTVLPLKPLAVPAAFVLLNAAAMMALFRQRDSSERLWGGRVAAPDPGEGGPGRVRRRLGWKWTLAATLILLVSGTLPRVWDLGALGFYGDEELTAEVTTALVRGEEAAMPSGMKYRRALPYHWLNAKVVHAIGTNDEASHRLVSAVSGSLTPTALFLVGRWFVGGPAAFGAGVLLSFSEWHLAFSRMARMYAPLLLFLVISCGTLWRWGVTGRWRWLAVGLPTALMASTLHLFGGTAAVFPLLAVSLPGVAGARFLHAVGVSALIGVTAKVYDERYVSAPHREAAFEQLALPGGVRTDSGIELATILPLVWVAFLVAAIVGLLLADREEFPEWEGPTGRIWQVVFGSSITGAIVFLALGHVWGAVVGLIVAMLYFPGIGIRVTHGHRALWTGLLVATASWFVWGLVHEGPSGLMGPLSFPFPYPLVLAQRFPVLGLLAGLFVLATVYGVFRTRDRGARAAVLGMLFPLTAVGVVAAYAPFRYLFPGYPFMLLCASGAAILLMGLVLPAGMGGGKRKAFSMLAIFGLAASGVVSGHGIPQTLRVVGMQYGDPLDIPVHMFPTRPDHAGAGDYVRQRLKDGDVVVAEDPLQQFWYVGRVDYWLRSPTDARPFLSRTEEGELRDIYVSSELLSEPQVLLDRVEASGETLWVITSAETIARPTYYLTSAQRAFLEAVADVGTMVYEGRDGATHVFCVNCPGPRGGTGPIAHAAPPPE